MAIIQGNAKQGSTRGFYPKVINGSLRFNDDDSAYLSWTPDSAGDQKTWTWSGWVKRGNIGTEQHLLAYYGDSTVNGYLFFSGTDNSQLRYREEVSNVAIVDVYTSALFRDPSAWYHVVLSVDTTQATNTDRVKIYINGEVQSFSSATYFSQNDDTNINNTVLHNIGQKGNSTNYLDGYLANVHFIDGQAKTASDFGETKNGVWVAKDYAGTFGTNGFYLTFEDDTQVEAFNTVLWRGNGGTQSVTGVGFKPDLVWTKSRSQAYWHTLYDSVRGAGNALFSNDPNQETPKTNEITAFDSDGFTFGNSVSFNESGQTYVAWCWKAGDSNVSNTDGTITSTVRANDTYGFSIVSYTGTGSAGTFGHGLSSAPDMVIIKDRTTARDWVVYHSSLSPSASQVLPLNTTDAASSSTTLWNNTDPTSSVFSVGTAASSNNSGNNYIAYCWAEKTGYSKFGSYTGNGSNTGPSITDVGFRPSFLLVKCIDATNGRNWVMIDSTRDVVDPNTAYLKANGSDSEFNSSSYPMVSFTDNGFEVEIGQTDNPSQIALDINENGKTYIYAAFADTREAAFWLDQSGNDNDWQPVNLDHNDTVADSPTNNFATWNPLAKLGSVALPTFSDGNLTLTTNASVDTMAVATMGITSGTFYYEATLRSANTYHQFGVASKTDSITTSTDRVTYFGFNGYIYNNATSTSGYGTNSAGDVLGVACDADAGTVKFYLNNTLLSTESWTSNTGLYIPFMAGSNGTYTADVNFGQQPFKYDPPA